jgi:hypothetical protein
MCKILKGREDTSGGASSAPNSTDTARVERWRKMLRIGEKLHDQGEYDKSMQTFQRFLSDFADVEDAECLSATFQAIWIVYREKGEHAMAI